MPRSQVCVDANIIVALVTTEAQSKKVLALWTEWMSKDYRIVAPVLLRYEVTSAIRRKVYRGILKPEDARRILGEFLSLDVELVDSPNLTWRAFDLAARFNRPTTYDTHYLALAEMMGCEFWTADERLYNAVKDGFPLIRWLGDYEGES